MTQPAGGYDVDITRAPEAIRDLEEARRELESIKNEATRLGQVASPAVDQVSLDAAQILGRTAVGDKGSLTTALTQGIDELTKMIESLRSGFDAYQRGDDDAGRRLESSS